MTYVISSLPSHVIEPHLESDLFMETLRRQSYSMSRDELLVVVHQLTHAYTIQRASTIWAISEAARNGHPTGNRIAEPDSAGGFS